MVTANEPEVRPHVVRVLSEIDFSKPLTADEAEWLYNSTPEERAVVAATHRAFAEGYRAQLATLVPLIDHLDWHRMYGLVVASRELGPYWRPGQTIATMFKTAPQDVVHRVVDALYRCGWTEADGLPPRPEG